MLMHIGKKHILPPCVHYKIYVIYFNALYMLANSYIFESKLDLKKNVKT